MLIGLTGFAGAGKDTAAMYLCQQHNFMQVAFATPLRAMLIAGLGLTEQDFLPACMHKVIDWICKSPYQLLQTLGTEWGRTHGDPELLIRIATGELDGLCDMNVVISDVCFENEATMIRQRGGTIIRIKQSILPAIYPHPSEIGIELLKGEKEIWADRRLEDLFDELDAIVGDMGFSQMGAA